MTQQEALVVIALAIAFIAGIVVAASLEQGDVKRLTAQRDQARKDAAEANYRAAVAAERAEHARAQAEWWGDRR